jgi:hypothetical protein
MLADVISAIVLLALLVALAIWIESGRRHRRGVRAAEAKRRKADRARQLRQASGEPENLP